jgi:hypothetical protein
VSAEPVAWTPLCFDADELAGWHLFNDRAKGHGRATPCADCLPGFAADMHAEISSEHPQGRCNGAPHGVQEDEEMGTFSFDASAGQHEPAPPKAIPPSRRVELEVAAPPCGSCAHEPVCALRAAFEGMATVETSAPPLPDGLRLSLIASVECSHFLRDRAKPAPVRVLTSQERGQANAAELRRTLNLTPEQRARRSENTTRMNLDRAARKGAAAG